MVSRREPRGDCRPRLSGGATLRYLLLEQSHVLRDTSPVCLRRRVHNMSPECRLPSTLTEDLQQ
jgi:hypothetical protein